MKSEKLINLAICKQPSSMSSGRCSLTQLQLILTICGFHICKFAYSLKFICNPNPHSALSLLFMDMYRAAKILSHLSYIVLAEVKQGDTLSSCFSSHIVNEYLFCGLCGTMFFMFLWFLLVMWLFKRSPKNFVKVLSSVLMQGKP